MGKRPQDGVEEPSWSPRDGTRIVFTSARNAGSNGFGDLYVMDRDGANLIRLTKTGAWTPA